MEQSSHMQQQASQFITVLWLSLSLSCMTVILYVYSCLNEVVRLYDNDATHNFCIIRAGGRTPPHPLVTYAQGPHVRHGKNFVGACWRGDVLWRLLFCKVPWIKTSPENWGANCCSSEGASFRLAPALCIIKDVLLLLVIYPVIFRSSKTEINFGQLLSGDTKPKCILVDYYQFVGAS